MKARPLLLQSSYKRDIQARNSELDKMAKLGLLQMGLRHNFTPLQKSVPTILDYLLLTCLVFSGGHSQTFE